MISLMEHVVISGSSGCCLLCKIPGQVLKVFALPEMPRD